MTSTTWLTINVLRRLHEAVIDESGGYHGVLSEPLLESALNRPVQQAAYADAPDLWQLAAAYGFGIIKNHPFLDGNKRTGMLAIQAFLFRNGIAFEPDDDDAVRMAVATAIGEVDEPALSAWIQRCSKPGTR